MPKLRILIMLCLLVSSGINHAESREAASTTVARTGYEVDGRSSASVLAAQRSHAVSSQDQTLLSVFSGLLVIGVVVWLAKVIGGK